MMLARSAKMATTAKAVAKRVRFKNDHPNLMKPRATDRFIFEKNGDITKFIHEKPEPVAERPSRLRFGSGRSLAEMAGETPKNRALSISVTIEEVDPEKILRSKTPACPLMSSVMHAGSSEVWERMEIQALNRACSTFHDLLWKRAEITRLNDPSLNKQVDEITTRLTELKTEMYERKKNLDDIRAFH
jgi:hypothetical protein